MDKFYLLEILRKYLQGTATHEETQLLFKYYELFESEEDIIRSMSERQKDALGSRMQAIVQNRIEKEVRQPARVLRPEHGRWILRAAVFVLVISAIAIALIMRPVTHDPVTAHLGPAKGYRFLRLPDSSTVIISAASKIEYPDSFDGLETREVYLEGEAYFDIGKDYARPFIVHTGKLVTKVLGTSFSVEAWPERDSILVTVSQGRVQVGTEKMNFGIIMPGQRISYNRKDEKIARIDMQRGNYDGWKKNDLLFENVTVGEAMALLENRFNVSIVCDDDSLRTKRFTTTLFKDETLEDILNSICEFNDAIIRSYDKKKAFIVISSK